MSKRLFIAIVAGLVAALVISYYGALTFAAIWVNFHSPAWSAPALMAIFIAFLVAPVVTILGAMNDDYHAPTFAHWIGAFLRTYIWVQGIALLVAAAYSAIVAKQDVAVLVIFFVAVAWVVGGLVFFFSGRPASQADYY